jgi:hypothetical protein
LAELKAAAAEVAARGSAYSFSWNSQPEQEIKIPPGVLRSRSFTRFTILVGLPHLGQSVLLVVSMIFLRSAVLAILAMIQSFSWDIGFPRLSVGGNAVVEI